jgi:hypothetical protein
MKLILKARAGLTAKKIQVTRNGKTFQQTIYVRGGGKAPKDKVKSPDETKTKGTPKDEYKNILNSLSRDQLVNLSGEDKDYWSDHTDFEIKEELMDRFGDLKPDEAKNEVKELKETYDIDSSDKKEDKKGGDKAAKREKAIRDIVENKQMGKIDGKKVDLTTAGAMSKILNALSDESKKKFLALPIDRMLTVTWKLVSK